VELRGEAPVIVGLALASNSTLLTVPFAFQSASSQAIRFGSFRQSLSRWFPLSSGFALASASRLASTSMERYLFVVLTLTWPSQWAIVLRSTPERSRWMAVLCRLCL
jgi:hypothetical protein